MGNFVLEFKQEDLAENKIFYRYKYGDFLIWFSQCQKTGNIYSVSVCTEKHRTFGYNIYSDCLETFYPTKFEVGFYGFKVTNTKECEEMLKELNEVKDLLFQLYHFFETSEHIKLWEEKHKKD